MTQSDSVPPAPKGQSLRSRARTGARDGVYVAIGLTIIAVVVVGIASALDPTAPNQLPMPLVGLIALYFVGGVTCGAAYGALRPLIGSLVGSMIVGVALCTLGVAILSVFIELATKPTSTPARGDLATNVLAIATMVIAVGALVGVLTGLVLWARRRGGRLASVIPLTVVGVVAVLKSGVPFVSHPPPHPWWVLATRGAPILAALVIVLLAKHWLPGKPGDPD